MSTSSVQSSSMLPDVGQHGNNYDGQQNWKLKLPSLWETDRNTIPEAKNVFWMSPSSVESRSMPPDVGQHGNKYGGVQTGNGSLSA